MFALTLRLINYPAVVLTLLISLFFLKKGVVFIMVVLVFIWQIKDREKRSLLIM